MIAAIETTGHACSVALVQGQAVRAEFHTELPRRHDELLAAEFANMLRASGVRAADLHAIAVSAGPGSFTGIRIGVSLATGVALASGVGLVGVPTLMTLAAGASSAAAEAGLTRIVCAVWAGRGFYYTGVYNSQLAPAGNACLKDAAELAAMAGAETLLAGPDLPELPAGVHTCHVGLSALLVARCARMLLPEDGRAQYVTHVQPLYITGR